MLVLFHPRLTTYYGKDGHLGDQCHDIILKHLDTSKLPEVATSFHELNAWNFLSEKERLASCGNDPKERLRATRRWFETFHALSSKHGLDVEAKQCVARSNVQLRPGLAETFGWLERWRVPLIVISAGLREVMDAIMNELRLPAHSWVLANGLTDPEVKVTSREKDKALERLGVDLEGRHVLLLGDKPSDCSPLQGLPGVTALKLGFLANASEEKLKEYMECFDAVLVGDASMEFVNQLLDVISGTSVM